MSFSAFPNECIASQKGDICILPITLTYPKLSSSEHCLHVNEQVLGCWLPDKLPTELNVELEADSTLTLINENAKKAPSVMLKVKYRQASSHRRRVKNPWSIF
ncbi:DUF3019 domain-containing protein [Alteromonas gracilis]|uniref:DUF3019 domain-containing protein n=1 Tax=Alteromonas gracilis TaxID=1479524 RepID=UPI0037358828